MGTRPYTLQSCRGHVHERIGATLLLMQNLRMGLSVEDRAAALVRAIRIMRVAFVVFGVFVIYLVVRIPPPSHSTPNLTFELVITFVALANVVIGFFAPRFLGRVRKPITQNPQSNPIDRWMRVSLVSLACFNACMLFGFVLHFMGAAVPYVVIPTAAGLVSLLVWKPQAMPATED